MNVYTRTQYRINYPKENYKYYTPDSDARKTLTKLLLDESKGYCMYCGKKVTLEGNRNYQIEHSVDKGGNIHQEFDKYGVLEHCKYNMAISCTECNLVCKKAIDKVDLLKFTPLDECPKECVEPCKKYQAIRNDYIKMNAIILQPLGIDNIGDNAIAYNLLKHIYEPSDSVTDEEYLFLIQNHIDRFRLNSDRFSSAIVDLCVKIVTWIDGGTEGINAVITNLKLERYDNIIGNMFVDFIQETFSNSSCEKLKTFCRMLIVIDSLY